MKRSAHRPASPAPRRADGAERGSATYAVRNQRVWGRKERPGHPDGSQQQRHLRRKTAGSEMPLKQETVIFKLEKIADVE